MRNQVLAHLRARFESFDDLARQVSDALLVANVPVARNKTIAEHFWCVVGARESFANALRAGAWDGFSCSIEDQGRQAFIDALRSSANGFERIIGEVEDWSPARDKLLLELLEHEAMHEGQLIRHVYALGESLPSSWKWA
jgi:hypothetical protein